MIAPAMHCTPSWNTTPSGLLVEPRMIVARLLFGIPSQWKTSVLGLVVPLAHKRAPPSALLEFAHPCPGSPKLPHGHSAVTTESIPSPKQYVVPGSQPCHSAIPLVGGMPVVDDASVAYRSDAPS